MSKNLYELSAKLDEVRDAAILESNISGEEVSDYLGELVDTIEGTEVEIATQIGLLYKDVLGFSETIASEQKRLASMKKRFKEESDSMKETIAELLDGTKIKDSQLIVNWKKSKAIKLLVDAEDLPEEYQKIKVEANKKLLTDNIKAGVDVKKYALLEESNNVTIK